MMRWLGLWNGRRPLDGAGTNSARRSVRAASRHRNKRIGFEALEERTLLSGTGRSSELVLDVARPRKLRNGDRADIARLQPQSLAINDGASIAAASAGGETSQPLDPLPATATTADKPQSKVWRYDDKWWGVFPNSTGTYLWRLDGTAWTQILKFSTSTSTRADTLPVGDVTHVLLFRGTTSELASIQYVSGTYQFWSQRPTLSTVPLPGGVETATIDMDSTGRLWVAADGYNNVVVRYGDAPYSTWSPPIELVTGISTDDISVIRALPNGTIGVLWSNQNTDRFGFRLHVDGADPTVWSADEVPASQSALSVGGGMADDHLNLAVASDSTLYAAVKTSYDTTGFPAVALLVRRPNGIWDDLYEVDQLGTRGIVVLNEATSSLEVVYTEADSGGDIVAKQSALAPISFGPRKMLTNGVTRNNASSTRQTVTDELLIVANGSGSVHGTLLTYAGIADQPPEVYAGPDQSVVGSTTAALDGSAVEGQPNPAGTMTVSWSELSATGAVTFADASSADTVATFSAPGTYVLRLTATDGGLSRSDDVTLVVHDFALTTTSFQDGILPTAGYFGTHDTRIRSGHANTNYGANTLLGVDGSPDDAAMLKWDVSSILPGSVVHSASITINVSDTSTDYYEIYELKRNWVESQATWNNFATGAAWQTAGAQGPDDRGAIALGTAGSLTPGLLTIGLNAAGVALVQAWVDNSSINYGLVMQDYLTASDAFGFSSSEHATPSLRPRLNVTYRPLPNNEPNDPPDAVDDNRQTNEDTAATLDVLMNDSDPNGDTITLTTVSDPPNGTAVANANGTISYTPDPHFNGADSFTYQVSDGRGGTDSATVSVTVVAVNDAPSFTKGPNQSVLQDAGPQTVAGWATALSAGPADESGQSLTFTANNNNNALFADQPAVSPSGTLTFTPAAGASGSATVTLTLRDDGGTANGGADTSAQQSFTILVSSAPAVTVSFQDGVGGYLGTSDATIKASTPAGNFAAASNLVAYGTSDESSLVKWDVTSIVPSSTVLSATITVLLLNGSAPPEDYEIYEVLRPWVETEVTWNQPATGATWSTNGAQGSGDRGSEVVGSVGGTTLGLLTITLNAAGVAMVQRWVNAPGSNNGIIIQDYAASDWLSIASSEYGTATKRPKLTITYQ